MKPTAWAPSRHDAVQTAGVDPIADAPHATAVLSEIAAILALHLALALTVIGAFECWTYC